MDDGGEKGTGERQGESSTCLDAEKTSMLHLRWEYSWVTVHL